eukprot:670328_1
MNTRGDNTGKIKSFGASTRCMSHSKNKIRERGAQLIKLESKSVYNFIIGTPIIESITKQINTLQQPKYKPFRINAVTHRWEVCVKLQQNTIIDAFIQTQIVF